MRECCLHLPLAYKLLLPSSGFAFVLFLVVQDSMLRSNVHLNADPGTPHCASWFITTVLTVLGALGLETGVLERTSCLELDPWHMSRLLGCRHPAPSLYGMGIPLQTGRCTFPSTF